MREVSWVNRRRGHWRRVWVRWYESAAFRMVKRAYHGFTFFPPCKAIHELVPFCSYREHLPGIQSGTIPTVVRKLQHIHPMYV